MSVNRLPSISMEYREGSSDKIYRACIEQQATGGYVVNFAFGRRGATMNTGTKTNSAVPYPEAEAIYTKLVNSKLAKGYRKQPGYPGQQETAGSIHVVERQDTGLRAQLLNPITEEEAEAYLADDGWCSQEKYDGRRTLIRKTGLQLIAANRNGLRTGLPGTVASIFSYVPGNFVLDGELVGETFYAFDLLERGEADYKGAPYRIRLNELRSLLSTAAGNNVIVAPTVTGRGKRQHMTEMKSANKEGIVLKDLTAVWSADRPAGGGGPALKCKFWASCSCVVLKTNARRSVELALGGKPVGNVTIPPNKLVPGKGQVVEVRYLYVTGVGGSLYQPTYLGVRDDLRTADCTEERQRLKYKPQEEE